MHPNGRFRASLKCTNCAQMHSNWSVITPSRGLEVGFEGSGIWSQAFNEFWLCRLCVASVMYSLHHGMWLKTCDDRNSTIMQPILLEAGRLNWRIGNLDFRSSPFQFTNCLPTFMFYHVWCTDNMSNHCQREKIEASSTEAQLWQLYRFLFRFLPSSLIRLADFEIWVIKWIWSMVALAWIWVMNCQ